MPDRGRNAIVIGASSGIGAACVKELVARGYRVAALARREQDLAAVKAACKDPEAVWVRAHDVRDLDDVEAAFAEIAGRFGQVDMVIYASGVMPKITPETYDTAKDAETIAVNFLGCVAWLNLAAGFMRKAGRGRIAGISSIAGDRGRRGYPVYNASKAAMNAYLEALRNRVHRDGVRVTTIKPGYVDTAMTEGMKGMFWVAKPEIAARQIVDAVERGRHTRYVLRRWALVGLAIRMIPSFIFRKMNI